MMIQLTLQVLENLTYGSYLFISKIGPESAVALKGLKARVKAFVTNTPEQRRAFIGGLLHAYTLILWVRTLGQTRPQTRPGRALLGNKPAGVLANLITLLNPLLGPIEVRELYNKYRVAHGVVMEIGGFI